MLNETESQQSPKEFLRSMLLMSTAYMVPYMTKRQLWIMLWIIWACSAVGVIKQVLGRRVNSNKRVIVNKLTVPNVEQQSSAWY